MLNDLLLIERGLVANGIELGERHPDIKDMAKGFALRVRLDSSGRVDSVEQVAEAGRGAAWTLRDGQHNGFPGLKTSGGLLLLNTQERLEHDKAWDADKAAPSRRAAIMRLLDTTSIDKGQVATWPSAGHRLRIEERLRTLLPLANDPLTASVPAVFERFLASLTGSPSFLEDLLAVLTERVKTRGDEWLELVRMALIKQGQLLIDVATGEYQRDAGDIRQLAAISGVLSERQNIGGNGDQVEEGSICALSGQSVPLHTGSFPQPNLPNLGQTYIFARNRDIPSLSRYGHTADASFAIGTTLVRRLAGAIAALTQPDATGKTWRLIPPETGDKPDLLVVTMTGPQIRVADALADDDEVAGEAALQELASRVIDQSEGIVEHGRSGDEMTVLVLRAVDPANRKAIYARKVRPNQVWQAAANWQKAVANVPPGLGFPLPVSGKASVAFKKPPFVSPLSITPLSKNKFVDGGQRRVDVIGVSAAVAFRLFLREGDFKRQAAGALRMLLQRQTILLTAVTQMLRRGCDDKDRLYLQIFDPKADLRRYALRSTTWIAVLLHQLGRPKEVYMSGIGFKLGQLLAAADVVHVGYCEDVRGGAIPMTLIGNAVFSIAGSDPMRALSILQQRWKPYDAWAKTRPETEEKIAAIFKRAQLVREDIKKLKNEKRDEEARKLEWRAAKIEAPGRAMRNGLAQGSRIKPLSVELAGDLKQVQPSDAFRAELLLGYMAGLPTAGGGKKTEDQQNEGGQE